MSDRGQLRQALRQGGYRLTPPRQLVWQVLVETDAHLTAEAIVDRITRDHADSVNLASVYRALALLEDLDLVRASRLGEGSGATWELAHPDEHFHLVCRACGDVTHHGGTVVRQVQDHLLADHGFEAEGVELVVTGRCRACAGR